MFFLSIFIILVVLSAVATFVGFAAMVTSIDSDTGAGWFCSLGVVFLVLLGLGWCAKRTDFERSAIQQGYGEYTVDSKTGDTTFKFKNKSEQIESKTP